MSLIVPSLHGLCPLPAKLGLNFSYPGRDGQNFANRVFIGYAKTSVVQAPVPKDTQSFWQFDFFVKTAGSWDERASAPVDWDAIPGLLAGVGSESTRNAGVLHANFGGEVGVQVIVTRPTGTLVKGSLALHPEIMGNIQP